MRMPSIVQVGLAAVLLAAPAAAAPYSNVYVFGDSLSDNGNLAEILGPKTNFPNPPSYQDSFTNGPVAAAIVAGQLGVTLTPSLWVTAFTDPSNNRGGPAFVPGTNYAVAGATAAAQAVGGPVGINLGGQVAAFGAATALNADPNALYYVEIGGNDVRNSAKQGTGVAAELAVIQTLAAEGARNFLVVNVPNVGVIPEFTQDNPTQAAAATLYSQQYDLALSTGLASLALPAGSSLTQFDLYAFNTNILANPAAYGFTNSTDRCYIATPYSAATSAACGPNAANIGTFAYWDSIHPTAKLQALWAAGIDAALGLPVPEPASALLLGVGLAGIAASRRARRAATRG